MMPGFSFLTDSYSSPKRSIVPGAMFSTVTSTFFSISLTIWRPRSDFRLIASDFLLTLNWWKYHGSSSGLPGRSRRPGSPRPGFSILTTSAPNQASTSVEVVPASNCVKSTTLTPCRKLKSCEISLILFLRFAHESRDTACAFPRRAATPSVLRMAPKIRRPRCNHIKYNRLIRRRPIVDPARRSMDFDTGSQQQDGAPNGSDAPRHLLQASVRPHRHR